MKIQDQVCTLEQANRLKELGVLQKSLFYHHPAFDKPVFGETVVTETGKQYKKVQVCNDKKGAAAAFTVAELGLLLGRSPYAVYLKLDNIEFWHADYEHIPFGAFSTEVEAKAAILIHQLENKLIAAAEVNERFKAA
jgi:hypothetical protein